MVEESVGGSWPRKDVPEQLTLDEEPPPRAANGLPVQSMDEVIAGMKALKEPAPQTDFPADWPKWTEKIEDKDGQEFNRRALYNGLSNNVKAIEQKFPDFPIPLEWKLKPDAPMKSLLDTHTEVKVELRGLVANQREAQRPAGDDPFEGFALAPGHAG